MTIRPICRIRPKIDDNPPSPPNIPPPNSMPKQAGAEEARGEAAEHAAAGPVEEAAAARARPIPGCPAG